MTISKRIEKIGHVLVPPALWPLLKVYTDDKRRWDRSHHRIAAALEIEQAARQCGSLEELSRWLLEQRKPGPIVECWLALKGFRRDSETLAACEVIPADDLVFCRMMLAAHLRWWRKLEE